MTNQMHRKDKRRQPYFLLRLSGTLIAFGVVVFLIWRNWTDFLAALGSLSIGYFLVILLLALLSRLMITCRWFILLRVVEPGISFIEVFKLSFVGLFTTNVLPSTIGGDVVKLGGAVRAGLRSPGVTASLVMDRLVGMATMATFLPAGIIKILQSDNSPAILMLSAPGTLFSSLWQKFVHFIFETGDSLKNWFNQPNSLFLGSMCSYIHMACTFTMVYLILFQLADPISWWVSGGLWVLVYFITLIPVSINGLGLQEVSMSIIYHSFGGVSESNSLVLALLMRVAFMAASLPGALFLPVVMSGRSEQKKDSIRDELINE